MNRKRCFSLIIALALPATAMAGDDEAGEKTAKPAVAADPAPAHEHPPIGAMVAEKEHLPKTMAAVMAAVADLYDAHAKYVKKTKLKGTVKEAAGLKKIAKQHRKLAKEFKKTAKQLAKAKKWPKVKHDFKTMGADQKIKDAMVAMLSSHEKMVEDLQMQVTQLKSHLAKMEGSAGAAEDSKDAG